MSTNNVNIVIPAITVVNELIFCLKKLNNLYFKNFQVTIVLDFDNKKKISFTNYKVNKIIVGKKNMSEKRNLGVKKIKSEYVAFIDSDTYTPKDWLKNCLYTLKEDRADIVGGPDIPFENQNYLELISHYCKKSFFITGHLNYRKSMSPKRICKDWLASCNILMRRKFYLNNKGMNEKNYFQEDQEFFDRIRKKNKNLKVIFSPKCFLYHKERTLSKFFLQRLAFGTALIEATSFTKGIKGLIPIIPLFTFLATLLVMISIENLNDKLFFLLSLIVLVNIGIFIETIKNVRTFFSILLVILSINFASVLHILGSVIGLLNLKNLFQRRIYILSRNND